MKVSGDWLSDVSVQQAFDLLLEAGFQAFAVGGCVRNALLGWPVNDVDLATDARPDDIVSLANNSGIKAVPTGFEHGTVTLVIESQPIEITTFRKDVETNGRHAVVAFADDIATDASRRDFTINALYADKNGKISDPLGGLEDIPTRHIRFIGEAHDRIHEDALRILRFFRFTAWYGDPGGGLDADGLAACADNADMLDGLSEERIGAELRKLLAAPDPAPVFASMQAGGILARILPGASPELAPLIHVEGARPARWLRRLAAIGGESVADRMKLSNKERKHLRAIADILEANFGTKRAAYHHGPDAAVDAALILASLSGQSATAPEALAEEGAALTFPVNARMLMPPLKPGPKLGEAMDRLEKIWIESDFSLSAEALLRKL